MKMLPTASHSAPIAAIVRWKQMRKLGLRVKWSGLERIRSKILTPSPL